MSKRREAKMKYLPHVAVSWEAAALFSLLCTTFGAALFALATKRKSGDGPMAVEFTTSEGKNRPPTEPSTIDALAEALWLRGDAGAPVLSHSKIPILSDAEVPILSDSGVPVLSDSGVPVLSDSKAADSPSFTHPLTRAFWEEVIEPRSRLFSRLGELALLERVLTELDRHGLCSSVVSGDGKSTFAPTTKRFSRVTLLDHSLRVARRMGEIHDSVHTERLLYGKHMIAALAHDVGKMEHLRRGGDGRYVKDDHAAASARALCAWATECGGEDGALLFRSVIDAVRNHHRATSNPDSLLERLKKADMAAREEEFSGTRKNPRAHRDKEDTEPPEWLVRDIPRILKGHIGPAINVEALEKKPFARAISSTNGIVYVCPHYLFDGVREHIEKENIADMRFFDSSRAGELRAKLLVTNSLKSRNWVGDGVGEGYYASFWNYTCGGKKVTRGGFWIPVFAEAFGAGLSELEKRKGASLRRITAFSPCRVRGKKK